MALDQTSCYVQAQSQSMALDQTLFQVQARIQSMLCSSSESINDIGSNVVSGLSSDSINATGSNSHTGLISDSVSGLKFEFSSSFRFHSDSFGFSSRCTSSPGLKLDSNLAPGLTLARA